MLHSAKDALVVQVLHAEPVLALGLAAALSHQPGLDVRPPSRQGDLPQADVLLADYATGMQLALDHPHQCDAGIVVVALHHREQEIRRAMEVGVRGYVLLGCSAAEMAEAVRVVGRGSRYLCHQAAQCMADSLSRESLTARELEVLALLISGRSNKVIARELDIAVGTVKAHMKGIMAKLSACSRTHAVTVAVERGLVPTDPARGFASHRQPFPVSPRERLL